MTSKIQVAGKPFVQPNPLSESPTLSGEVFALRDTQDLASAMQFFQTDGSGNRLEENYGHNPIQGDYGLVIKQIGIVPNAAILKFDAADAAATSGEVEAFLNNLNSGYVEIWTGSDRCDYEVLRLADLFRFEYEVHYLAATVALVSIHPTPLVTLPNPIPVLKGEQFRIDVTFANAAGFSAANANGTRGDTLKLECHIAGTQNKAAQIAAYKTERDRMKSGQLTLSTNASKQAAELSLAGM